MLNRRILRIKAFKIIYSYAVTGNVTLEEAVTRLDESCEATRDLYLFMLASISPLTKEARNRIDAAKSKFNPTEEDLNPNEKFADNALAPIFDEDPDFQKLLAKKKLSWDQYDIIIRKVLDSAKTKSWFEAYMSKPTRSLKEDCNLFIHIFEEEFVDNDDFYSLLEEKSILWTDDLAYSLTFCCRTLKDIAGGERWHLPELYQSDMVKKRNPSADVESDKAFVRRLLQAGLSGYERYFQMVCAEVPDWDSDRLFSTDMAIIALGLAEAECVSGIPLKVTINEWVEISKFFGSPKSSVFVNGLLDKLTKKMIADGAITGK